MPRKRAVTTKPVLYKQYGSRKWYVRFSANGQRIQKSTGEEDYDAAKRRAEEWWRQIAEQPDDEEQVANKSPIDVFDQYADHLITLNRSETHRKNHDQFVERYFEFFQGRALNSLTRRDIERWRDWLLKQHRKRKGHQDKVLSWKTVKEHLSWLNSVRKHYGLPSLRIEYPKKSDVDVKADLEYYTTQEMRTLLNTAQPNFKNYFTFLAFTGCRKREPQSILNMPEHIDRKKKTVRLVGKGSKVRILNLSGEGVDQAWKALLAEIKRRKVKEGEPVFHQYPNFAYRQMMVLCKLAEIPRRKKLVHSIRHTFATHALIEEGWNISLLAKWLGHQDIGITFKIYGHLIPTETPKFGY